MKNQLNQLELEELFKSLYAIHTVYNEDTENVLNDHEELFGELLNSHDSEYEFLDKENFKNEQLKSVDVLLHKLKGMIEEEE